MSACRECGSEADHHPHPLCAPCLESLVRYDLGWRMGRERSYGVFYLIQEGLSLRAAGRALDRCFRQYVSREWT